MYYTYLFIGICTYAYVYREKRESERERERERHTCPLPQDLPSDSELWGLWMIEPRIRIRTLSSTRTVAGRARAAGPAECIEIGS